MSRTMFSDCNGLSIDWREDARKAEPCCNCGHKTLGRVAADLKTKQMANNPMCQTCAFKLVAEMVAESLAPTPEKPQQESEER